MSNLARLAPLSLLVLLGCSSPASDTDVDTSDATAADAPTAATLRSFTTSIYCVCTDDRPASTCPAQATITVFGDRLRGIDDATVVVNGETLPHGANGNYGAVLMSGFAATYTVVVSRGSEQLMATFAAPSDFQLTVTAPAAANSPATVQWTPSGEDVIAQAHVQDSSAHSTDLTGADNGQLTIPGTAFPMSGTYGITLSRNRANTSVAASASSVDLVRGTMITVP